MTGALAVVGIIGARRRRNGDWRRWEDYRYAAKLDRQLCHAIDCIGQRLVHDGWGAVTVEHDEQLRTYTFIVVRHHQDRGTWRWSRTFGRSFLVYCDEHAVAQVVAERVQRAWEEAVAKL